MKYDESWNRPHQPTDNPEFQESDCYWFYDAAQGVGGFHRIGQKPNRNLGQIMLMAFKEGGERFTMNDSFSNDHPINLPEDRWESGHRVRKHTAEHIGGDRMRYTWDEDGSSADLEFYEQFYTPRSWPAHNEMANMNPGHLEVAGRIRGTIRIGAGTYEIDALAHRDRSWGFRNHSLWNWHRYRMSTGTTGPEFSYASFALDSPDKLIQTGYVVRNGVEEEVVGVRILTTMDADGFTTMGSNTVFTLASGEKIQIPGITRQCFMSPLPLGKTFISDNITEITYNGKKGFSDVEMTPNPGRGEYVPSPEFDVTPMALVSGLSKSGDHTL